MARRRPRAIVRCATTMVVVGLALAAVGPPAQARASNVRLGSALENVAGALHISLQGRSLGGSPLLPQTVRSEVTRVVMTVSRCVDVSERRQATLTKEWSKVLAHPPRATMARAGERLASCAQELERAASRAATALDAYGDSGGVLSLDLWPLLRIETARGNHVYEHDYALLIDTAGDDTYRNNAGGNLLDFRRGPDESPALEVAPARGCRNVGDIANVTTLTFRTDAQCVPAVGVVVDTEGDDHYGHMEEPAPADDGRCTKDPLVRRIMTVGAGFAGVGLLVDTRGNDVYLGKTGAIGAGHVGGVGIVHDARGDDIYRAIRNSQGFGLVYGSGTLLDRAGDDDYGFYMPSPLDLGAEFQERGSGGVIDDTGLCDNLVRQLQGTAQLGGQGSLVDRSGDDVYVAVEPALQPFHSGVVLAHGSQAFGSLGGYGMLLDGSGDDAYLTAAGSPMPGRGNGMRRGPSPSSTARGGVALFVDVR